MKPSYTQTLSVQDCLSKPLNYKLCSATACVPVTEPCPCEEQEFECTDGRCIPRHLVCNGNIDCLRGEDELCSVAESTDPGERLSAAEVSTIVSVSVFVSVVVIVLLYVYYTRRQKTNTSRESQAEPLQREKPSDTTECSDKETEPYNKTRHKHSYDEAGIPFLHYSKPIQGSLRQLDDLKYHVEQEQCSNSGEETCAGCCSCDKCSECDNFNSDKCNSDKSNSDKCNSDKYDTALTDVNNSSRQRCRYCQSSPIVKHTNTKSFNKPLQLKIKPCSKEESQTKMGKYIYKPRTTTRGAPTIYHSFVPSHTEPSTPESVDFDRDKISFLFANELLCASTPKQTAKRMMLYESQDIDFIDDSKTSSTHTTLQR